MGQTRHHAVLNGHVVPFSQSIGLIRATEGGPATRSHRAIAFCRLLTPFELQDVFSPPHLEFTSPSHAHFDWIFSPAGVGPGYALHQHYFVSFLFIIAVILCSQTSHMAISETRQQQLFWHGSRGPDIANMLPCFILSHFNLTQNIFQISVTFSSSNCTEQPSLTDFIFALRGCSCMCSLRLLGRLAFLIENAFLLRSQLHLRFDAHDASISHVLRRLWHLVHLSSKNKINLHCNVKHVNYTIA